MAQLCFCSSADFLSAISKSLCTFISLSLSLIDNSNWANVFSFSNTSFAVFKSLSYIFFMSNFIKSCSTKTSSLVFTIFCKSCPHFIFSNSNSSIIEVNLSFSFVIVFNFVSIALKSSFIIINEFSNFAFFLANSDVVFSKISVFLLISLVSSCVRFPWTQSTFLSINCIWKSTLYNNSPCLFISLSNFNIFAFKFFFALITLFISPIIFASFSLNSKSFLDSSNN